MGNAIKIRSRNGHVGNSSPRILIVDDSAAIRYALGKELSEAGFKVAIASDGKEGLSKALDGNFDAICTDIDMPNMNGFELCEALRADPRTARTPILVLSSRASDDHVERGFQVGADAYLSKEVDIHENIERIRDIIDARHFLTGSRVLVVDDSKSILQFIERGLTEEGFVVRTARNGREAWDMLPEFQPEMIITDVLMPEMDGCELCRMVKRSPEYSSIPVIFMSTVNEKATMRRLMREGAATYLIKPFTINQLSIVIEEVYSTVFRLLQEEKERLLMEHRLTLSAIASLVQALEARDATTHGHSQRVACLAVGIGEELGLKSDQLERLKLSGWLHDLGKIGVRDDVLLKKDRLNNREFEHIKDHSTVVADILRPIKSLRDILEVTSMHHERWDGKGYPAGLKGEEIPLMARIVAVADVFEAMTAVRPYRDPLPGREALAVIVEERGKQLCPQCVDAFLRWYDRTDGEIKLTVADL